MKSRLITALVLSTTLFAACGDSKPAEEPTADTTEQSATTETTVDFHTQLKDKDLSKVFFPDEMVDDRGEKTKRQEILGFIGDFQRFYIHFTSVTKNPNDPYQYMVAGKTKVKNNICQLTGTITITAASFEESGYTEQEFPGVKGGSIYCTMKLNEDAAKANSGTIEGNLTVDVYMNKKGEVHYNALMLGGDGYSNSQFIGTWTEYKTDKKKKCNFGDYRIPEAGDLAGGDGMFIVNEAYTKYGWESNRLATIGDPESKETKEAIKKEEEQWWK